MFFRFFGVYICIYELFVNEFDGIKFIEYFGLLFIGVIFLFYVLIKILILGILYIYNLIIIIFIFSMYKINRII